jgi:hypothetical protein
VIDKQIKYIVPGDFNYDGKLDLLVAGGSESTETYLHVYLGDYERFGKLSVQPIHI